MVNAIKWIIPKGIDSKKVGSLAWWYVTVIPAPQDAEAGEWLGSRSSGVQCIPIRYPH